MVIIELKTSQHKTIKLRMGRKRTYVDKTRCLGSFGLPKLKDILDSKF